MQKFYTNDNQVLHKNLKWETMFKRLEKYADFKRDGTAIFKYDKEDGCYYFFSTDIKSIFLNNVYIEGYSRLIKICS